MSATEEGTEAEAKSRVILDPSVLFLEETLGWLEDPEFRPFLVISEALWRRLEDPSSSPQLLEYAEGDVERIVAAREALASNEIARFSLAVVSRSPEFTDGARAICGELLNSGEELADVLADEWAFLVSQSLAIVAEKMRHSLGAFRRAGATVIEIGREEMEATLEKVQNRLPPRLLTVMKLADNGVVKLVVAGGGIAAFFVPPLHLPMGVANAARLGVAVIAGDP
jgi:hypothetical protein